MNTQEELQEKLSKLEKELWYLIKHTLPSLKDEILGGGNKGQLQELEKKITDCQNKVESLESEIQTIKTNLNSVESESSTLNENLQTLSGKVETNQNNITSLSEKVENSENNISNLTTKVSKNESDISTISNKTNSNQANISALSQKVETNETNISTISNKAVKHEEDIAFLNTAINGFDDRIKANADEITIIKGNVSSLSTSVGSINNTLSAYQTKLTNMTYDISDNHSQIQLQAADLQDHTESIRNNKLNIESLASRVSAVENRPSSGGGRAIEVIYDMKSTDEAINKGFTTGIPTGNNVYWTDSEYDYIRIFATLNSLYSFIELPTANRPKNDFVMSSLSTNGKTVHYLKGILYYSQKRVAISRGFTYTFDTTTNTIAFATDNPKYLITRIEGVKGI